jgi:hypothetical protein
MNFYRLKTLNQNYQKNHIIPELLAGLKDHFFGSVLDMKPTTPSPPRAGPPLLLKEGKLKRINALTFSSF